MTAAIREAGFDELGVRVLYDILQLRVDVFVVEQACPYHEVDGHDLSARHFWIEEGGRVVSYLRVIDDGRQRRIGRVVTAPSHRSAGLSTKLLDHVLVATEGPWRLAAQTYLRAWYASFGFVEVGEDYLEDDIPHVDMVRTLDDMGDRSPEGRA